MTTQETKQYLEDMGIQVYRVVNSFGKPKATISWRDYPKLAFSSVHDPHLGKDFTIAQR